MYVYFKLKNL